MASHGLEVRRLVLKRWGATAGRDGPVEPRGVTAHGTFESAGELAGKQDEAIPEVDQLLD
jgi:hypothetical protein